MLKLLKKIHLFYILIIILCLLTSNSCRNNKNKVIIPRSAKGLENLTIYSKDTQPEFTIEFENEQHFGDTKEVFFKYILQFTVDEQGRVYIPQGGVYAFRADGSYLTKIGQEGKGPGEFQAIASLKARFGRLYIYDTMADRLTIFSLDSLNVEKAISPLPPETKNCWGQFYVIDDNTILIGFEDASVPDVKRYIYFYKLIIPHGYNRDSLILKLRVKEKYTYQSGNRVVWGNKPFTRNTLVDIINNGNIFTAYTDNFLVKHFDQNGKYLSAFFYPFNKVDVNKDKLLDDASGLTKKAFNNMPLPQTYPALNTMLIDDKNRLWISTIVTDMKVYKWWVLNKRGELLARFTWPQNKKIKLIKNGKLYALEEDEQTGVDEIVRYDITFTGR